MKRLSKEAENKIIDAVEEAVDLVTAGSHPDEAISKIAAERGMPLGHVQLVVQAYNTGKTISHRKQANSVLEKASEFPLASFDVIKDKLFPSKVKTAAQLEAETCVAQEYALPPSWVAKTKPVEKMAASLTSDKPLPLPTEIGKETKKLVSDRMRAKHKLDEARMKMATAYNQVIKTMDKLAEYFAQFNSVPFCEVFKVASVKYGKQAEIMLNEVANRNPHFKKQASRALIGPAKGGAYSLLESLFELSSAYHTTKTAYVEAQKVYNEINEVFNISKSTKEKPASCSHVLGDNWQPVEEFNSTSLPVYTGNVLEPVISKEAAPLGGGFFGPTMSSFELMKSVADQSKDFKTKQLEKFKSDLDDPIHDAELRNIHTQAMLNDLISNDEVISGYDPQHVLKAYNDLSQVAPRTATSPIAVRALLRKHLSQGQVDPYEVDLIMGLENKMKQRDEPSMSQNMLFSQREGK